MNHRQLYVCYMALFDDGWSNADIAVALGITPQEASDIATGMDRRGLDGDYVFQRCPTVDENGLVVAQRDSTGKIIKRVPRGP